LLHNWLCSITPIQYWNMKGLMQYWLYNVKACNLIFLLNQFICHLLDYFLNTKVTWHCLLHWVSKFKNYNETVYAYWVYSLGSEVYVTEGLAWVCFPLSNIPITRTNTCNSPVFAHSSVFLSTGRSVSALLANK